MMDQFAQHDLNNTANAVRLTPKRMLLLRSSGWLNAIIEKTGDVLFDKLHAGKIQDIPEWFWRLVKAKADVDTKLMNLEAQESW